jgi:hypothetical protein
MLSVSTFFIQNKPVNFFNQNHAMKLVQRKEKMQNDESLPNKTSTNLLQRFRTHENEASTWH